MHPKSITFLKAFEIVYEYLEVRSTLSVLLPLPSLMRCIIQEVRMGFFEIAEEVVQGLSLIEKA